MLCVRMTEIGGGDRALTPYAGGIKKPSVNSEGGGDGVETALRDTVPDEMRQPPVSGSSRF